MLTRRKFIQLLALSGGAFIFSSSRAGSSHVLKDSQWFMPDESHPHKRIWMALNPANLS